MRGDRLRAVADEINRLHAGAPGTKALADDYRYVGLCGEAYVADLLGLEYRVEVNGSDGGKDLVLPIGRRAYKVDVKTARKWRLGMLAKLPLRADIYVFVAFEEAMSVVGWQWKKIVAQAPVVDKGHGIRSHEVPNSWLRDFKELLAEKMKEIR